MTLSSLHRGFALGHRFVAVLGVALVFILCALAVRPDLHEALCHHHSATASRATAADNEDIGCVVTQFADGQLLASLFLLLLVVGPVRVCASLARERVHARACVRYQLPPGCGPPTA